MNQGALLFPVHIAMLILVVGFLIFLFMSLGGVRKIRKINRKTNKKIRKAARWLKSKNEYKKNWFYDI